MLDEGDNYCLNYVKNFDRDHFLCSLFLTENTRFFYLTIHALNIEINNILYNKENEIASAVKLKWWQEKILMIYENKFVNDHQILINLHKFIHYIPKEYFIEYFAGYEKLIFQNTFQNLGEIEQSAYETTVILTKILMSIYNYTDTSNLNNIIYHAGLAWNMMNNLRNEYFFIHYKNKTLLPYELLEEPINNIGPHYIKKYKKIFKEIVKIMVYRIETHIDYAYNLLRSFPHTLLNIELELKLADLYLQKIRKLKYDIFSSNIGQITVTMQIMILIKYIKIRWFKKWI